MTESDRPAAGIMRHYSRLTDVADELAGELDLLRNATFLVATRPADAARRAERVQALALRLAGQAEWLRAQLEPES